MNSCLVVRSLCSYLIPWSTMVAPGGLADPSMTRLAEGDDATCSCHNFELKRGRLR